MFRNRGFAAPIVLVVTIVFLLLPVIFWYSFSKDTNPKVKGASVKNQENTILLKIVSPRGTWELQQYLCENKNECTSAVFSGKRYATISGGKTQGHFVSLLRPESQGNYKLLKVFVVPGSGTTTSKFKTTDSNALFKHEIEKATLTENKTSVEVILIPLESFANTTGALESIDFISE